jgi:hypothetical protein
MKRTITVILLFLLTFQVITPGTVTRKSDFEITENWLKQAAPLTSENLILALKFEDIIERDWILSQAFLETGYLTSRRCIEDNNLFGMKMPHVRQTTACAETSDGFAIYRTWYDSVEDMRLFQQYYRSKGWNLENYPSFLERVYAQDKHYLHKLYRICITLK